MSNSTNRLLKRRPPVTTITTLLCWSLLAIALAMNVKSAASKHHPEPTPAEMLPGDARTEPSSARSANGTADFFAPTTALQASSLAAHWRFDEASGTTAADSSGNGNTAALSNGTSWSAGKIGNALSFDGVDDQVNVAANASFTALASNFTLAFWASPRSTHEIDSESTSGVSGTSGQRYAWAPAWYDGASGLAGAGVSVGTNGVSIYEHAGGYLPALLVCQTPLSGWNHIAVVYESNRPKLYINGVLMRTGLQSQKTFVRVVPQQIGGMAYGNFDGSLDDVRVYRVALSSVEIQSLATPPPVAYLRFDEAGGTTAGDSSGNGNTGALVNGVTWTAGRVGGAARLDGVDDYVQVGAKSSLVMTVSMTMSAWIYPLRAGGATEILMNKEGEYELARFDDGTIRWAFANSSPGWAWVNTGYVAPANQWSHLAIVYDNGNVKTYANGSLVNTYSGSGAIGDVNPSMNDFRIGDRQEVHYPFQGSVDEVVIHNGPLSPTEVESLALAGPVGYWKFDEGSGTTANDSSGNGNAGTLANGTSWSAGRIGSALSFDGVDDQLSVTPNASINTIANNFTLAFWASPNSSHEIDPEGIAGYAGTSGQKYVWAPAYYASGEAGAGVSVGTNGVSVYEHAADYMPALLVYQTPLSGWTHVAVVYENKRPKLYIDGTLVRTGLVSPKTSVRAVPQQLGGMSYGYFKGLLDDVRLYGRALNSADVQSLAGSAAGPIPVAPSNLSGDINVGLGSRIDIAWRDNSSNESGFKVQRKLDAGGSWSVIATLPANTVSFPDTAATASTPSSRYSYRVVAYNSAGDSVPSNEIDFTVYPDRPTDTPAASAPSGCISTARPTFTWSAVARASKYWLIVSDSTDFSSTGPPWIVNEGSVYATSFTPLQDLPTGKTLYWRVKALNNIGTSAWSDTMSFTVYCSSPLTVRITSPLQGATVSGTVPVAVDASSGINRVEFYVDGVLQGTDAGRPYEFNWNTTVNPLPTPNHSMDFGYYFIEWKDTSRFAADRAEVNPYTNLYYANLSGYNADIPTDQKMALLNDSLSWAVSHGKRIHLALDMDLTDAMLNTAAPYWSSVIRIEVADETDMSRAALETWIAAVNSKLAGRGLASPPQGLGVVYNYKRHDPLPDSKNAAGMSWIGIETYLDYPGSPVPQVNIDNMNAQVGRAMSQVPAGRNIVLVTQAYDRNGCWTSMDTLRDLQIPPYLIAYNNPRVISLNMFAYARSGGCFCPAPICGGARDHPELKTPHKLMGEKILNASVAGAGQGPRTISVKGFDANNNVATDRITVTVGATSNNAAFVSQSVPVSLTAGQTANVSVSMQNTGSTTWTAAGNYKLGSLNPVDNTIWGLNRVIVPSSVAPGAQAVFNFTITAPATPGSYDFQWGMLRESVERFGSPTPNVTINVTSIGGLPPPTNLTATAISTSQITLGWTDNSPNEAGFKIERKTGAGGTYAQIATVGPNVTTFFDSGLSASTTYSYQVRAFNASGNSAYSNEASATTSGAGSGLTLSREYIYLGGRLLATAEPATTSTVAVFRDGTWSIRNSGNVAASTSLSFGAAGDVPIIGDWNGDGIKTIGLYRQGTWYLRNSNTPGAPDLTVGYGAPGDIPVAGDWNGDGVDTIGVFRNGTWLLRNSNAAGSPDVIVGFGVAGDIPVVGDWNGDGFDTVGVYRTNIWYLRNSNTSGAPDATVNFGAAGDIPLVGDWNSDGVDTLGVYRQGTWYLRDSNTPGPPDRTLSYGAIGDKPIAGLLSLR